MKLTKYVIIVNNLAAFRLSMEKLKNLGYAAANSKAVQCEGISVAIVFHPRMQNCRLFYADVNPSFQTNEYGQVITEIDNEKCIVVGMQELFSDKFANDNAKAKETVVRMQAILEDYSECPAEALSRIKKLLNYA